LKWVALMVALIVAGAVAAFAIYTFGWRAQDKSSAAERASAQLAANRIALQMCGRCKTEGLVREAGSVWRVHAGGGCYLFDPERLHMNANGAFTDGVSRC
jgi:hypothetical protein